jgi:hypothetical protein
MAVIENSGELRSIIGPEFALIFERIDDRWTHSIAVSRQIGGPRELIARAVEWFAERDDSARVVSPVFQELHFQTDPAGNHQALLVGMSGGHHFSAVFALTETESGTTLAVDTADRTRSEVIALASTYTVLVDSSDLGDSDDTAVSWTIPPYRLEFRAGPATAAGVGEAGRRATRGAGGPRPPPSPATHRWQYEWRLSRSPSA